MSLLLGRLRLLADQDTGSRLLGASDGLHSLNGEFHYAVADGICFFLPSKPSSQPSLPDHPGPLDVRGYYETEGWAADASGQFGDTKAFVDTRSVSLEHTRQCMRRLTKYFRRGGQYLLDAGCGAIPHDEYLEYGAAFDTRVCVDFSGPALMAAKRKLGNRGIYLQGDLTKLPLKDNSIDAVTCNHVLYHVPAADQERVLLELWRVLKPGGLAVIVYAWNWSPIAYRLRRAGALLLGDGKPIASEATPDLYFHPHSLQWFETREWPFACELDTFRLVDNGFLQRFINDGVIGRSVLGLFSWLQRLAPTFCGRYGQYPVIIIRK